MTVKELIEKLSKIDPNKMVGTCKWFPDSEYTEVIETESGVYLQ